MAIMQEVTADQWLREYVHRSLDYDERVDPADIEVEVTDGVAQLSGFVNTPLEKWAAEEAARETYGVHDVVNEIEVSMR